MYFPVPQTQRGPSEMVTFTREGSESGKSSDLKGFLFHQGNDSILEVFRVLSEAEVQQKMKKKEKKAQKKAAR